MGAVRRGCGSVRRRVAAGRAVRSPGAMAPAPLAGRAAVGAGGWGRTGAAGSAVGAVACGVAPAAAATAVVVAAAGGIRQLGVVLGRELGRGQPHAEQRAAAGVLLDPHLPVVRRHDLGDDGQAEAGAAVGAGAGVVEPHEPLEDPAAVVGGDAGTVVGDVEGRLVAVAPERDDHLRTGVPVRVVDQVAQHPHELAAVADDPNGLGAHLGAHPVLVRPRALRLDELVEIHLVAPGLQAALIGAGEEQEVVHQPPEPLGLAAQRAHGAGIAVLQQLQTRADGGERAAQLVAGVGDEPPLHLLRALQPRDHAVHGLGEPTHLVARHGHRHALGQVLLAHRRDLRADRLDRAQRAACEEVGGRAHDEDEERHPEQQVEHDRVLRGVDRRQRRRVEHDEMHLVGRGRDAADGHERRVHRAAAVGHVRRGHHDDVARVGREVAHRAERAVVGALLQGPAAAVLVVGVVDDDLRQRRVALTHQGVERLDGVLLRGVRAVDALPVVAVHPVGDRLRLLDGIGFDRVAQRLPHQQDQRHARHHQRQSDHGRRRQRGRSPHPGAGPQPPRSQCHATRVTMRDCGGAERTGAPCTNGDALGRTRHGEARADPGGRRGSCSPSTATTA